MLGYGFKSWSIEESFPCYDETSSHTYIKQMTSDHVQHNTAQRPDVRHLCPLVQGQTLRSQPALQVYRSRHRWFLDSDNIQADTGGTCYVLKDQAKMVIFKTLGTMYTLKHNIGCSQIKGPNCNRFI